ncbi:MAG: amidophosphoribosyltransferase, partial [Oscillospiraceae bacterium]|nr:amidophosphoribosyltransferase [Oscillospiraceae bacterium]
MGGFFGVASKNDCMVDVFFGTDYHSHLGTRRGGMAAYDEEVGLQRQIHNIENSPFRTRFENIFDEMKGNSAIGCISSMEPQPLLIRSGLGAFAICFIGVINNADELIEKYLSHKSGFFNAMTGGKVNSVELLAALISLKDNFTDGIKFAQEVIDGSACVLILKDGGNIIAARDKLGRLPVIVGKDENGFCVTFESFAAKKLGYNIEKELGPGEIVELTPDRMIQLAEPGEEMRICAFLWTYYGYSTSAYEGINVEAMRYRNGSILAQKDKENNVRGHIDYVGGVPDSGTPHAIGYANESKIPFARPF